MTNHTLTKFYPSDELVRKAYGLFLAGHQVTEIAYILDFPVKTLRKLIFGGDEDGASLVPAYLPRISDQKCWAVIKAELDGGVVASYVTDKKLVLEKVNATAIECVVGGLDNILAKVRAGKELKVAELKMLSDMVGNLDKIVRLESGQATDITKIEGLTAEELRKVVADDPFAIVDVNVEYKEITVDKEVGDASK